MLACFVVVLQVRMLVIVNEGDGEVVFPDELGRGVVDDNRGGRLQLSGCNNSYRNVREPSVVIQI